MMSRLITILALAALSAAACVTAGSSSSPSSVTPTPASTTRYELSTRPADLILRVQTSGGLVPPGMILTEVPGWTMFGDGRVIVPGAQPEIYPAPLLPNLRVMQLRPDEMQKIVAAADEAGLLGPDAHYDVGGVADAGTTTFTLTVAGKVHTISAYALGIGTQQDPALAAARQKLMDFDAKLADLPSFLGRQIPDATFEPAGMRLFVRVAEPPSDSSQPTAQTLAWPLSFDPVAAGQPTRNPGTTCVAISGRDLSQFEQAASAANSQTVWTFGRARYWIQVRPLYPNESGC